MDTLFYLSENLFFLWSSSSFSFLFYCCFVLYIIFLDDILSSFYALKEISKDMSLSMGNRRKFVILTGHPANFFLWWEHYSIHGWLVGWYGSILGPFNKVVDMIFKICGFPILLFGDIGNPAKRFHHFYAVLAVLRMLTQLMWREI